MKEVLLLVAVVVVVAVAEQPDQVDTRAERTDHWDSVGTVY